MKTYSIEDIIEQVRIKYDEFGADGGEMVVIPDNVDINTIIKSNVGAAYRFVVFNADLSMLEGKTLESESENESESEFSIDDNLVGHLSLPVDFMRGITMRLSSWKSSPSSIIEESSSEYRMQADPYACGTPEYPVVALIHTNKGKELEFYKAKSKEDELKSFVYIPSPPNDLSAETGSIQIADQLSDAFIYYVAALTATTFREDVANDFFKVARSLIGIE